MAIRGQDLNQMDAMARNRPVWALPILPTFVSQGEPLEKEPKIESLSFERNGSSVKTSNTALTPFRLHFSFRVWLEFTAFALSTASCAEWKNRIIWVHRVWRWWRCRVSFTVGGIQKSIFGNEILLESLKILNEMFRTIVGVFLLIHDSFEAPDALSTEAENIAWTWSSRTFCPGVF